MVSSKPSLRHVLTLTGILLVASPAASQQVARVEAFFGYSFVRVDAAGRVPAFNANGGNAQFLYNFRPWFGLVADFGGSPQSIKLGQNWNSSAGIQLSQQLFNQQVFTGLQAARSSEEYYSLAAQLTEEQIIELVANNYYQVLVNRQQLNVIDTNIKNVKVIEKIITPEAAWVVDLDETARGAAGFGSTD